VLTGSLCGLVLGVAVDAAVWLWVFGQAMSGQAGVEVPLIVSTTTESGDVVAQTGAGILVLPLVLALCGAGLGCLVAHRQRSGTSAEA
jgi:hypothetical protein